MSGFRGRGLDIISVIGSDYTSTACSNVIVIVELIFKVLVEVLVEVIVKVPTRQ